MVIGVLKLEREEISAFAHHYVIGFEEHSVQEGCRSLQRGRKILVDRSLTTGGRVLRLKPPSEIGQLNGRNSAVEPRGSAPSLIFESFPASVSKRGIPRLFERLSLRCKCDEDANALYARRSNIVYKADELCSPSYISPIPAHNTTSQSQCTRDCGLIPHAYSREGISHISVV